jgi:hypothetical protein
MKEGTNTGRGAGLLLICALLGGITGAAAMKLVDSDTGTGAPGTAADAEMVSVLRALTAETAALRDSLSRPAMLPAVTEEAALREPTPLSTAPDLLAALERLTALTVQLLEQQGVGGPLVVQAPSADQHQRLGELIGDEEQWRSQLLWPSQKLLDAFGKPHYISIEGNGSEAWVYKHDSAGQASFIVHAGRVTGSYVSQAK